MPFAAFAPVTFLSALTQAAPRQSDAAALCGSRAISIGAFRRRSSTASSATPSTRIRRRCAAESRCASITPRKSRRVRRSSSSTATIPSSSLRATGAFSKTRCARTSISKACRSRLGISAASRRRCSRRMSDDVRSIVVPAWPYVAVRVPARNDSVRRARQPRVLRARSAARGLGQYRRGQRLAYARDRQSRRRRPPARRAQRRGAGLVRRRISLVATAAASAHRRLTRTSTSRARIAAPLAGSPRSSDTAIRRGCGFAAAKASQRFSAQRSRCLGRAASPSCWCGSRSCCRRGCSSLGSMLRQRSSPARSSSAQRSDGGSVRDVCCRWCALIVGAIVIVWRHRENIENACAAAATRSAPIAAAALARRS